jgi:hypothetical protein
MAGSFRYRGQVYPYFVDSYQNTRINERAVEVSIALARYNKAIRPLEVGAVLPHYIPDWPEQYHEVIDLHEDYPAVIRANVLTYSAIGQHDLVMSISTLDHLNNVDEVMAAVGCMKSWVTRGKLVFATVPAMQPPEVGGGEWLDELVLSGDLDMSIARMDKTDPDNHEWREVSMDDKPLAYNGRSNFANTVYILEWRRP